jgi:hypothetical protein
MYKTTRNYEARKLLDKGKMLKRSGKIQKS